jgi:predicted glycosyltransferase
VKNVVFLVKNGIGYGHLRRALILADALLDVGQVRPVIISQASSLNIFTGSRVAVVNFPLLHRVPSAVAEDWYTDVLDKLLDRLNPAVIIEDTYPDQRYARLASLADRPRLLVLRRLDHDSFDTIRTSGAFTRYDQILIAQNAEDFAHEGHSDNTRTAVDRSGRFRLIGPLHRAATAAEIATARSEYNPDGMPLVVVSAGAGGDQMPDGYGDRLFSACNAVAIRLHEDGVPARFVLVTGPYYAGRPLEATANVTVHEYEPRLHALLAAADVAVIKPGHNVLSEALTGGAQLILVPDVSFMEGLDDHAARVTGHYGGAVARPDPDELETLIRKALTEPARQTRLVQPPAAAIAEVVAAVHNHADPAPVNIPASGLRLTLTPDTGTSPPPTVVVADPRRPERLHRHIRAALASNNTAHVTLDLDGLEPAERAHYIESVHRWLDKQPIRLLSDAAYLEALAQRHLEKQ